jgi:hypothetical protein
LENEIKAKYQESTQNMTELTPSPKDHKGLLNFLRQKCNGQNPQLEKMVKVSASHFYNENRPEYLFTYERIME